MFYDTPLDFFIFFSSTTAVMGNSGQSTYIAGNMFMNALAAQRKKRGVAASSIDISSIIGLGYVERAEDLSEDTFINKRCFQIMPLCNPVWKLNTTP